MRDEVQKAEVRPLSQRDKRWSSKLLGFSSSTLGGYGCAVACVAMWLNAVGSSQSAEVRAHTPETVNEALKERRAFRFTNFVDWKRLPEVYPAISYLGRVECRRIAAPLVGINTTLADFGVPVIVYVDFDAGLPAGHEFRQHFVLITRKAGDNYVVADPWIGAERLLAGRQAGGRYYGPTAAVAICGVIMLGSA